MKITAEFNTIEELFKFAERMTGNPKTVAAVEALNRVKEEVHVAEVEATVKAVIEEVFPGTEEVKTKAEVAEIAQKAIVETFDKAFPEEPPKKEKITKEKVRAIFTTLVKAGKQAEAKALTTKYGASKLPELSPEHYETVYQEAMNMLDAQAASEGTA